MERKSFIRLTGLTAIGYAAGGSLFASAFKRDSYRLVGIEPPKIHVRHGLFNVQTTKLSGLHVQRDIFNKNGLDALSDNRILSLMISDSNKKTFGVGDQQGFTSKSDKLSVIKIESGTTVSVKIDSPSLLFAEFGELSVNDILVKNDQAMIQYSNAEVKISSLASQLLFIYKLKE